jgi:hypothetical protein
MLVRPFEFFKTLLLQHTEGELCLLLKAQPKLLSAVTPDKNNIISCAVILALELPQPEQTSLLMKIKIMHALGAKLTHKNCFGETPLHLAAEKPRDRVEYVELMQVLLSEAKSIKFNINDTDHLGNSILMLNHQLLPALQAYGFSFNLDLKNKAGMTAVLSALCLKHFKMALQLIKAGASIEADTQVSFPANLTHQKEYREVVSPLSLLAQAPLQFGPDVEILKNNLILTRILYLLETAIAGYEKTRNGKACPQRFALIAELKAHIQTIRTGLSDELQHPHPEAEIAKLVLLTKTVALRAQVHHQQHSELVFFKKGLTQSDFARRLLAVVQHAEQHFELLEVQNENTFVMN